MNKKHLVVGIIGLVATLPVLGAATAAAATQVGNTCAANFSTSSGIPISLASAPGQPPAVVPSAGVITSWSFNLGLPLPPGFSLSETLKLFRPTGAPKQFQVVGESSPASIASGPNTFLTRLPVQTGDHFGAVAVVEGTIGGVFCETKAPGDQLGLIASNPGVGSTATIAEENPGFQNPIIVFVEPDVDKDGFGDETQDKCPQSAAIQVPCPVVTLDAVTLSGNGAVTVLVAVSNEAQVSVTGVVKLGNGKKATLKAAAKPVLVGKIARFTLKFPAKLKSRLKELEPKKSLNLKVTASATNVVGQVSTDKTKAKLKGQG